MTRNNFFIFTGGPGSGKSSLLNELQSQGYLCIDEAARLIIKEQLEIGGDGLHWANQVKFRDLMMERMISDFKGVSSPKPVVFDRGLPGLIGYSYLIGEKVPAFLKDAVNTYRYNRDVFMTPPWKEIYVNDAERKQDYSEAVLTYEKIKLGYLESGYNVIDLPKVDIQARALFVTNHIESARAA